MIGLKHKMINPYYKAVVPFIRSGDLTLCYDPPWSPEIPLKEYTFDQDRAVPRWAITESRENFGLTIAALHKLSTDELHEIVWELSQLREAAENGKIRSKTYRMSQTGELVYVKDGIYV